MWEGVMMRHAEALRIGGSDGEEAVQEWQSEFVAIEGIVPQVSEDLECRYN